MGAVFRIIGKGAVSIGASWLGWEVGSRAVK